MVSRKKASKAQGQARGSSGRSQGAPREHMNAVANLESVICDEKRWQSEPREALQSLIQLISRLRELQKDVPFVAKPRTSTEFSAFTEWLQNNGVESAGKTYAIRMVDDADGDNATLYAQRSIAEGELVVSVPPDIMLTSESAFTGSLNDLLARAPMLRGSPSVILALRVLQEALDSTSRFAPYMRVLPREFTIPFSAPFSADEYEALRPSPAYERGVKTLRSQAMHYCKLYGIICTSKLGMCGLSVENLSYRNFEWAVSVAMTRQNALPSSSPGGPPNMALIPVWDMCNHAVGAHTTAVLFDPDTRTCSVECTAMRAFNEGDPISIFYGQRSNIELLLYSGFVVSENEHDALDVYIPVPDAAPKARMCQTMMLKRFAEHSGRDVPQVITQPDNSQAVRITLTRKRESTAPDPDMFVLGVTHLLTAKIGQIEALDYLKREDASELPQGDDQSEAATLLNSVLTARIAEYPATLDADTGPARCDLITRLHAEETALLRRTLSGVLAQQ